MDAGRIVTALTVTVIIIYVFMSFILMVLPLKMKLELDTACREQQLIASRDMGLSMEQIEQLKERLSKIGLSSIVIKCPGQGSLSRYEESDLSITGNVICKVPNGFLTFERMSLKYAFEGKLLGRRILN